MRTSETANAGNKLLGDKTSAPFNGEVIIESARSVHDNAHAIELSKLDDNVYISSKYSSRCGVP